MVAVADTSGFRVVEPGFVPCEPGDRLFDIWNQARGGQIGPAFGHDIHVDDIDWHLLPNMSIVDVVDNGNDYFFRFWGTRNATVKRYEMTGRLLSESPFVGTHFAGRAQFGEVIKAARPLAFIYQAHNLPPTTPPQLSLRFPLSNDGKTVTGIMSYQDLDRGDDGWKTCFELLWSSCTDSASMARRLVSLR